MTFNFCNYYCVRLLFFNGQLFPNSLLDFWSVRLTKSTQLEKIKYCSKLFPTYIASHAYKETNIAFPTLMKASNKQTMGKQRRHQTQITSQFLCSAES